MTTAAPSTALATIQSAFTDAERLALAGFLAGYRDLTREAYALDLRQFTSWCRARFLALFTVRRADIESFALYWSRVLARDANVVHNNSFRRLFGSQPTETGAQGRIQVDEAPWWVRKDVVDYVTNVLRVSPDSPYHADETTATRAVAEVLADAGTSFLFAEMAAEHLAARSEIVDIHDPAWRTSISQGVLGVFGDDLRTLPDPDKQLKAVHLLRAVAFAFGPGLPWRNVWPLLANDVANDPGRYGDSDIAWLLGTRLGGYLVADYADGVTVYRLFHDNLRNILYERWSELLTP